MLLISEIKIESNKIIELENLTKKGDCKAEEYIALARGYWKLSNFSAIIKLLSPLPKITESTREEHLQILDLLFKAYFQLGQKEEALSVAISIVEIDKTNANKYDQIATLYSQMDKDELGEKYSRVSIDLEPNNVDYLMTCGKILSRISKFSAAANVVRKALNYKPNDIEIIKLLITVLLKGEKYDDAADLVENTKRIISKDSEYFRLCGLVYSLNKEEEKAGNNFQEAINIDKAAEDYILLTTVYSYSKKWLSVKQTTEEGLEIYPNNSDLLCHLGLAHSMLGHDIDAKRIINKAVEIDPTNKKKIQKLIESFK